MPALQGTVALVTGASSGIGAATAQALAGQGAAVALAARRAERLAEVAEAITGRGGPRWFTSATSPTSSRRSARLIARSPSLAGSTSRAQQVARADLSDQSS
jgi:NAD(P)-dependent dehydrogenase (short-subunit alcohol dehydrogenase family)